MKTTFVTREFGKTGSDITKEEFMQMMLSDIDIVKVEYRKWSDEVAEQKYFADYERYAINRQQVYERIVKNSYEKYKKEYYRLRWVEKMMTAYPEVMERDSYFHYGRDLQSIRWRIKPWDNATAYIDIDKDLERTLGNYYEDAIKNKYFKQCTGWSIAIDDSGHTTEFKLHLSDELQNEWKADEHHLAESIAKFYEGCTYWGD